jgi:hypothetical protein
MDEICLFTATRAATAGIAIGGAMVAAVNEASLEAGRTVPWIVSKKKGSLGT